MTPPPGLYRTIWRWHFYAGLLVLPLILVLSLSGALYLFKPQVERWEERSFQGWSVTGAVAPSAQVAAASTAFPGSRLVYYRLPQRAGDAVMMHLALGHGRSTDAFVSPQGRVLGHLLPERRIIAIDRAIHGQLLLGPRGSWIVELAASWAIVLIVTGLYLWWPRGRGAAGVIWPRLTAGGRTFWRDIHAVTGFWVSGLALVLLFTGLPWASAWGSTFQFARAELGWVKDASDWTVGGRTSSGNDPHTGHDHGTMAAMAIPDPSHAPTFNPARFDRMVANAAAAHLAFPVLVVPPGMPSGEGGSGRPARDWVVRSDAQNCPLRVTLHYDAATGALRSREGFADSQPIDRLIGYGVAWHEGQLFGAINQLVGLATALMLITLVVSGTVMWWQRRPEGTLGAPVALAEPARLRGIGAWVLLAFLMVWLPLFTGSLLVLVVFDRLVLPRLPGLAQWLGIAGRGNPRRPV